MRDCSDIDKGGSKKASKIRVSPPIPRKLPARLSKGREERYKFSVRVMDDLWRMRRECPSLGADAYVTLRKGVFEGKAINARTIRHWDSKTKKGKSPGALVPRLRGPKKPRYARKKLHSIGFPLVCQRYHTNRAAKKRPRPSGIGSFEEAFKFEWKRKYPKEKTPSMRTVGRETKRIPKAKILSAREDAERTERVLGPRSTIEHDTKPFTVQTDHQVEDFVTFETSEGTEAKFSIALSVEPASGVILSTSIFEGSVNERKLCAIVESILRFDVPPGSMRKFAIWKVDGERAHEAMKSHTSAMGIIQPPSKRRKPHHRGAVENRHRPIQNTVLTAFENWLRQKLTSGEICVKFAKRDAALKMLQGMLLAFQEYHNSKKLQADASETRLGKFRRLYGDIPAVSENELLAHLGKSHPVTVQRGHQTQVTIGGVKHNVYHPDLKSGETYDFVERGSSNFLVFAQDGDFIGDAKLLREGTPERRAAEAKSRKELAADRKEVKAARREAAEITERLLKSSKKAPESQAPILSSSEYETQRDISFSNTTAAAVPKPEPEPSAPVENLVTLVTQPVPFVRVRGTMRVISREVLP